MPINNRTTIDIPLPLNDRLKALALKRSKNMGLSRSLSRTAFLELLIKEEEERTNAKTRE